MRHSQHSFRKALSLAYGGGKEAQWFSVMQRLEQVELSPEEVGIGMGRGWWIFQCLKSDEVADALSFFGGGGRVCSVVGEFGWVSFQ